MSLYRPFRVLKKIGVVTLVSVTALILLPWLFVAGNFIYVSFTDTTDWRIEDYMCTIPEGCDEFIAQRRRWREQKQTSPAKLN